jgi:hypothetical protein
MDSGVLKNTRHDGECLGSGKTLVMFPVLQNDDHSVYPADGLCPICKKSLQQAVMVCYLNGGALFLTPDLQDQERVPPEMHQAFLHIGIHGNQTDGSGSEDVMIVDNLHDGQFDLNFCSTKCLKQWFSQIIERLKLAESKF